MAEQKPMTSDADAAMADSYAADPPGRDERLGEPYLAPTAGSGPSPDFGLQLPARLNVALAAHAAEQGITVADIVRRAVGEYFDRHGIVP